MCCSLCINHNVHIHTHSAHTPQHRLLQYFECNWSVSRSAWCICESMRTRHIRGTKNCRYGCKQSTTSYVCWLVGSTRIGMSAFQHTLTHTHLTSMWQRIAWKFHQKKCIEKPKPYHLCQYSTRQNTIAGHHLATTWPRTLHTIHCLRAVCVVMEHYAMACVFASFAPLCSMIIEHDAWLLLKND